MEHSKILHRGGGFAKLLAGLALLNLTILATEVAYAAASGSCQSKLSSCTSELSTCMSQENTLTNNLNTCNSNEGTCTNSLNSCVNTLAALQGGTTGSTTRLLYTFVTNTSGFDTGIAISNTSADPFGTPKESGQCTLTFFGSGGPAPLTTPTIAAGTTYWRRQSRQASKDTCSLNARSLSHMAPHLSAT